jgi:hypothetical protein
MSVVTSLFMKKENRWEHGERNLVLAALPQDMNGRHGCALHRILPPRIKPFRKWSSDRGRCGLLLPSRLDLRIVDLNAHAKII